MIYAVYVLAILFALLHIAAAATQLKEKVNTDTAAMMSAGAAVMAASVLVPGFDWLAALFGGLLVCSAALMNGKKKGKVSLSHHAIRGAVVAIIVLGYIIW